METLSSRDIRFAFVSSAAEGWRFDPDGVLFGTPSRSVSAGSVKRLAEMNVG